MLGDDGLVSRNLTSTVRLHWSTVEELRCVHRPGLVIVEIHLHGTRRRLQLGAATRWAGHDADAVAAMPGGPPPRGCAAGPRRVVASAVACLTPNCRPTGESGSSAPGRARCPQRSRPSWSAPPPRRGTAPSWPAAGSPTCSSVALRCASVGVGPTDGDAQLLALTDCGRRRPPRACTCGRSCVPSGVAVFVQIATNFANDYSDGKRGTDAPGERVGPPRLVGNGLATAEEVKRAMLVSFGADRPVRTAVGAVRQPVAAAGRASRRSPPAGSTRGALVRTATPGSARRSCSSSSGWSPPSGSFYVQTASMSWLAVGCGVAMGCLATALLVVNNLRDIPGDTRAGKQTLAVRLGDQRTRYLYVVLLVVPMLMVPFLAGAERTAAGRAGAAGRGARPVGRSSPCSGGARGRGLIPVLGRHRARCRWSTACCWPLGLFLGG